MKVYALLLAMMCVGLTACEVNSPVKAPAPIANPAQPAVAAVDKDKAEQPAVAAQKPQFKPVYSPFVLDIKDKNVFRRISFKDVGAKLDQKHATMLYESLAEALRAELSNDPTLSMRAEVSFDKAITDPKNHLACGSDHLYIDFWRSQNPQRWGYSLWSGCGEDDNFAWKEFVYTVDKPGAPVEEIAPLAKNIVSSIKEANAKGCYQKAC